MTQELQQKATRIIALGDRLADCIAADLESLSAGRPREMRSLEPESQQLTLLYSREAKSLAPDQVKALPADLRKKLQDSTRRLQDLLAKHARMLTRVRHASEGIIRTVADEVERRRNRARPYGAKLDGTPKSSGAMLVNCAV
ncbi:MAG: hypothetical protein GC166_02860 [Alphaproteobacteria bacterium]|nr:hypothetical protein [Alphaproteobacteria bacterium]